LALGRSSARPILARGGTGDAGSAVPIRLVTDAGSAGARQATPLPRSTQDFDLLSAA
jgi:hypothetical protein